MSGEGDSADSVEQFTGGLRLDEIRGSESFSAEYGDRNYTVYLSASPTAAAQYVLYFVDDTVLKKQRPITGFQSLR